jgi:diketogulonate reductase-like aldo/keto reductase
MESNNSKATKLSDKVLKMNDGNTIPIIGLGTYQITVEKEIDEAVKASWDAGYKHIDSAVVYRNEKFIGNTLKAHNIPREQLFITTKIPPNSMNYDDTYSLVERSLKYFQTDYLDLVLIHFPRVNSLEDRINCWKALEKCVQEGKVKSIGVSNFLPIHLKSILDNCTIKPAVNQFELHPLFIDWETIEACKKEGILVEAYSAFAQYDKKLINNKVIQKLSQKHNAKPTQILVRWCLQHNWVVIPKSTKRERIFENIDIDFFELSEEEMESIDKLNCDYKKCWDPRSVKF